jgi:hypothetical protein
MPRLNVRCCCQPQKILGTLEVASLYPNQRLAARRGIVEIEVRAFCNAGEMEYEFAVYSDDRPIEFWRQFASFQEAPSETPDLPLSSG